MTEGRKVPFFCWVPSALLSSISTTEGYSYFLHSPSQDSGGPITSSLSNHSSILVLAALKSYILLWTLLLFPEIPLLGKQGSREQRQCHGEKPKFIACCCHPSGLPVYLLAGPSHEISPLPWLFSILSQRLIWAVGTQPLLAPAPLWLNQTPASSTHWSDPKAFYLGEKMPFSWSFLIPSYYWLWALFTFLGSDTQSPLFLRSQESKPFVQYPIMSWR